MADQIQPLLQCALDRWRLHHLPALRAAGVRESLVYAPGGRTTTVEIVFVRRDGAQCRLTLGDLYRSTLVEPATGLGWRERWVQRALHPLAGRSDTLLGGCEEQAPAEGRIELLLSPVEGEDVRAMLDVQIDLMLEDLPERLGDDEVWARPSVAAQLLGGVLETRVAQMPGWQTSGVVDLSSPAGSVCGLACTPSGHDIAVVLREIDAPALLAELPWVIGIERDGCEVHWALHEGARPLAVLNRLLDRQGERDRPQGLIVRRGTAAALADTIRALCAWRIDRWMREQALVAEISGLDIGYDVERQGDRLRHLVRWHHEGQGEIGELRLTQPSPGAISRGAPPAIQAQVRGPEAYDRVLPASDAAIGAVLAEAHEQILQRSA